MGCDIHISYEKKDSNGKWIGVEFEPGGRAHLLLF